MVRTRARSGIGSLVALAVLALGVTVVAAPSAEAMAPTCGPMPAGYSSGGVSEWQSMGPDVYLFVCNYASTGGAAGPPHGVAINVEYACPPHATDRFDGVTGAENTIQRGGTIAYESDTGQFTTYTGQWTLNEKVFLIPEPTVFVTFATYSDSSVWLRDGTTIGNDVLEGLAETIIDANRAAAPLPACPTAPPPPPPGPSPAPTPGPPPPPPTTAGPPAVSILDPTTTTALATTTTVDIARVPLCAEALSFIQGFGEDRLAAAGITDPNRTGMRVGLDEIRQGFTDAVRAYNEAHPEARAFASPGLPYGSAGALQWLFSEGGVIDPVSEHYVTNHEGDLRDAIAAESDRRAAAGEDPHLGPGDVYGLALELEEGDSTQAMLLGHNTLRSLARAGDVGYTGVQQDAEFFGRHLQRLRDNADNAGPWYHMFGTGYYAMVDDGDYGEGLSALGFGIVTAAGGWSVAGLRILYALGTAGGAAHLALSSSDVTNVLEQLYREQAAGRTPDPEKFCYNVWGAVVGGLLYGELPFKTLRNLGSGPFSTLPEPTPRPGPAPPPPPVDSRMMTIVNSPFSVLLESGDESLLLDQGATLEEVRLLGSVPGVVLPVPEEKGSWGLVWMQPHDGVQDVTLEASVDGATGELVRIDGETGEAAVYELTATSKGDRFTVRLDDEALAPPIVGPDGAAITPDRLVDLSDGGALPDPYATSDQAAPTAGSTGDDDTGSAALLLGGVAVLGVALLGVALVLARRQRS